MFLKFGIYQKCLEGLGTLMGAQPSFNQPGYPPFKIPNKFSVYLVNKNDILNIKTWWKLLYKKSSFIKHIICIHLVILNFYKSILFLFTY